MSSTNCGVYLDVGASPDEIGPKWPKRGVDRSLPKSMDHGLLNLPTHNCHMQDNTSRTALGHGMNVDRIQGTRWSSLGLDIAHHVTLNEPPTDLGNASTMYRSWDSWMDGTWLMATLTVPPQPLDASSGQLSRVDNYGLLVFLMLQKINSLAHIYIYVIVFYPRVFPSIVFLSSWKLMVIIDKYIS